MTATDKAGNTVSAIAHYTVVDVTAPAIALATPSQGAVYDLGQQVAASYSCKDEDGGSGLATCSGTVGNGENVDTSSVGEKSFSVSATDNAGNPASRTVTYRVVDRVAPEITLTSPSDGAVYSLGQHVPAAYSCVDQPGGSGLAKCDGTVANGADIDTMSFGAHTFEVHASDGADNAAVKSVTYTVSYDFDGFFWPVKNLPNVTRWRAGLPVPVRFSLSGFKGARPEADGYPRSTRCGGGDVDRSLARPRARRRLRSSTTGAPTSTGCSGRPTRSGRHLPRLRPEARRRQPSHRALRVRERSAEPSFGAPRTHRVGAR